MKRNEFLQIAADLKTYGEGLVRISDALTEWLNANRQANEPADTACADAQENSAAPVQASVEADGSSSAEDKLEITFEELRGVCAEKAKAGFTAEVRNLLGQYGVNKLSELKPEDYVAFRAEVEVLGRG